METLTLPVASFTVTHLQSMSSSDWRMGASQRRYRDGRERRVWDPLRLRGRPGQVALSEWQFNRGACGAAAWLWLVPGVGSSEIIVVRFTFFEWITRTAVSAEARAIVVECLSSDS